MDMKPIGQNLSLLLFPSLSHGWVNDAAIIVFYVTWWVHLLILLTFLVYVPQSKHAHLIAGPVNVYFNRLEKPGKLTALDFEDESQENILVSEKLMNLRSIS